MRLTRMLKHQAGKCTWETIRKSWQDSRLTPVRVVSLAVCCKGMATSNAICKPNSEEDGCNTYPAPRPFS